MNASLHSSDFFIRGVQFQTVGQSDAQLIQEQFSRYLNQLGLTLNLNIIQDVKGISFSMKSDDLNRLAPAWDTTQLSKNLNLNSDSSEVGLEKEIVIAMLLGTISSVFPNFDEFLSAVRMRKYVVIAGRKTALNFDTGAIERPEDFWHYDEDAGFLLNSQVHLIDALVKATQPEEDTKAFSFSCYRATEYVILLSILLELREVNPDLLNEIEVRSRRRAIRSGEFHEVFLREYGSIDDPYPMKYYIPGDRVWFRNPDSNSSDVSGYEGSWVIYLGNNLFTNFWQRNKPFTLESKCIEVYHWKDGLVKDAQGEFMINEAIVRQKVEESMNNPSQYQTILARMMRYRDAKGVYEEGGCIDTSRESPRWVRPGTTDMLIPA